MHRAHFELTKRALQQYDAHLLIHPAVGETKPGDIDYITRVQCYKKIIPYYDEGSVTLSLLPLAMRMAGPREALWHAIIRKNYGCTHFIIGRDHAGPGKDSNGNDFYKPYQSQQLVMKYADEIGITIIPFEEMVYIEDEQQYAPRNEIDKNKKILTISGTQLRQMLKENKEIPSWFSFPEIIKELKSLYNKKKGLTIWLTGLSGSGKTTIAHALIKKLKTFNKPIIILDGDEIRKHISPELGFSKQDRSTNVKRIGFIAHLINQCDSIAVCPLISPYEIDRSYVRNLIQSISNFIEIYIATPLEICEQRDPKGLYEKAREGLIPNFTGITDPYEIPSSPELIIDTSEISIDTATQQILDYIQKGNNDN